MTRLLQTAIIALAIGVTPSFAQTATEWDGLTRVESPNFNAVYLAPGADFSGYTKVMLDPTEAAFHRDWVRDYNRDVRGVDGRISSSDAARALELFQSGFEDEFREAYTRAGYQVVTEPGPDVLRLRTAVTNIRVTAPDQMRAARSRTYSEDAGEATLIIEARDSLSGSLLGRGVDRQLAGDDSVITWRSSSRNRSDFREVFEHWGERSARALSALRATPAPAAAQAVG